MNRKEQLEDILIKFEKSGDSTELVNFIDNEKDSNTLTYIYEYDSLNTPSVADALYMNLNTPKRLLDKLIDFLEKEYEEVFLEELKTERKLREENNSIKKWGGNL